MHTSEDNQAPTPIKAAVLMENGRPALYLDDQLYSPNLAFLNGDTLSYSQPVYDSEIAHISNAGLHLYSTITRLYFDEEEGLDPRHQAVLDSILDNDPQARILLRVHTGMGRRADTPESELFRLTGQSASDSLSLASDLWLREAAARLTELVGQIRRHPRYAGHVFGYHLECGEWMQPFFVVGPDVSAANRQKFREWLCRRYPDAYTFEQAWGVDYPPEEAEVPIDLPIDVPEKAMLGGAEDRKFTDDLDYIGELTASGIERLAMAVKQASHGENLVIAFYGYYFEIFNASSGHFHFRSLLESPWLDGFASPVTYMDRRTGELPALACSGFMTAVDTVVRAGKLWYMESDQRTFINRTDRPWDHTLLPPLWSIEEICKAHRREIGLAMIHGTALYPMDLAGLGWYDDAGIWTHFMALNRVYAAYTRAQKVPPAFDVALVIDESAQSRTGCSLLSAQLLAGMMIRLYHTGLRFAQIEIGDLERGRSDDMDMYIFVNPFGLSADRVDAVCKTLRRGHKTALFLYGFGDTDPVDVRRLTGMELVRERGVCDLSLRLASSELLGTPDWPGITIGERTVVTDSDARVLGVYADGSVGFAQQDTGEWNALFCGGAGLSVEGIRALARESGVPVCCETTDVFAGDRQMLLLSPVTAGEKTLHFGGKVDVWDYFENRWYEQIDTLTFRHMEIDDCKWLFYGERDAIEAWNLPAWQEINNSTGKETAL